MSRAGILAAFALMAVAVAPGWTADSPGSPESSFGRGVAAYRGGEFAEAIALFDAALREEPDNGLALYYRGLARAKTGAYEVAIPDLEAAAAALPDLPVAADLGVANYRLGRRAEAMRWLEKAQEVPAGSAGASLLLGIMAYEAGDLASAQRHLAEADAGGDSRVKGTAAYYLGLVAVRERRAEDARSSFEQAEAAGEPPVSQAAARYAAALTSRGAPATDIDQPSVRPYSLYANGALEYDSNLLIADIPLSQRQALPFDDAKNDGRFALSLGAAYDIIADERALLQIGYDFYQSLLFSVDRLDLQGHTLRAVFEYGDGIVVPGIEGSYNMYLTDGTSTYLSRVSGSPYVLIQEEGFGQSEVYYAINGDNYIGAPFNPYRDGITNAVGLRQAFFLGSEDRVIDVGYQWRRVSTDGSSAGAMEFEEQSNQVDVGLDLSFPDIARFQARWLFSNDDYLNPNSRAPAVPSVQPDGSVVITQVRRRDDRNVVMLLVSRDIVEGVYASVGYYFTDSGSNLPVFDYSRNIISASVGVTF